MEIEQYIYSDDDYILIVRGIVYKMFCSVEHKERLEEWKKIANETLEKAIAEKRSIKLKTTWFPLGQKYANHQWLSLEFEPVEQDVWLVTKWRGCNGWAWPDIGLTGSKKDKSQYIRVENLRKAIKKFIDGEDLLEVLEECFPI